MIRPAPVSAAALVLAATAALLTPSAQAAPAPAASVQVPAPPAAPPALDRLSAVRAFAIAHRVPGVPVQGAQEGGRYEASAASSGDGCARDRLGEPRDEDVLDISSTYLFRCDGAPERFGLHVQTFDTWADSTLYAALIDLDTDFDTNTGCEGDDYFVIGFHDEASGLVAAVGETPSCDDATWIYRGDARIDRGGADRDRQDLVRLDWDAAQVDTPRGVSYTVDTSDGYAVDTAPDSSRYFLGSEPRTSYPTPVARDIRDTCDGQLGTPFLDAIGTTHEYSINCVSGRRITSGRTPVTYEPDGTLTRGQTATFLVNTLRAAGYEPRQGEIVCVESDVHADNMSLLAELGVIPRPGNRVCDPTATIDRAVMALWTRNALTYAEGAANGFLLPGYVKPVEGLTVDYFRDDEAYESEPEINIITTLGVATGKGEATYGPAESLTRGQMATFLARSLDAMLE